MKTYRLGSNEGVYAPGVVAWAKQYYWNEPDRPALCKVIMGWGVPEAAVDALLSGAAPYTIDGETVVFSHEE
jgi:hypothetical protein